MQKPGIILILTMNGLLIGQNTLYISRMYETEDKGREKLSIEYVEDKKNNFSSQTIYFLGDHFNRIYFNNDHRVIAKVNEFDSVYYQYFKHDSAITYNTHEGKPFRDSKLIFNKKKEVILDFGYLHKTNLFATYQRNTYLNDTLLLGKADFYIQRLYDMVDTSQSDSIFYTYDKKGRKTGEYSMKRGQWNEIDSSFIYEYDYTDTSKTFWGYKKVSGKFFPYKRSVTIYDGEGNTLKTLYYDYPDKYDGCSEYFYEQIKDSQTKVSKSIIYRRADGSIWKTMTYRHEIIER